MTMSLSRLARARGPGRRAARHARGPGAAGGRPGEAPAPAASSTWFDYGDPGRLDVHAESPLVVQQATAGIYSGLLHYDPDEPSKIVGDLAERWTVSPDGKTYTFHLRKGVKWHDGQPFSSADVKASFDRVLNPDFKSPKCGASLKPMVASVEAVDPNTVEFQLKFAAAPFLPVDRVGVVPGGGQARAGQVRRPQRAGGPDRHRAVQVQEVRARQRDRVGEEPELLHPRAAVPRRGQAVHPGGRPDPARGGQGRRRSCCGTRGRRCGRPRPTSWRARATTSTSTRRRSTPVPRLPQREEAALRQPGHAPRGQPGPRPPGAGGQGARGRGRALRDPRSRSWSATSPCRSTKWPRRPAAASPRTQDIAEAKKLVEKHHPNGLDVEVAVRQVGNYVGPRRSSWSPSSARSASAAPEDPRERGGLRGLRQGRLHDHRHPGPRDGRQRARAASSTSPTPPRRAATTASTRIRRSTSWPSARSRRPTATSASRLYWELQRYLLPRATTPPSRWAGWRAGSSRTRSSATTSPASPPTTTTPS